MKALKFIAGKPPSGGIQIKLGQALAFIIAPALAIAGTVWENNVLVLTDDDFDEAVMQYDHLLLEFYAPWCSHCKQLAPEFEAAAKTLRDQDTP